MDFCMRAGFYCKYKWFKISRHVAVEFVDTGSVSSDVSVDRNSKETLSQTLTHLIWNILFEMFI